MKLVYLSAKNDVGGWCALQFCIDSRKIVETRMMCYYNGILSQFIVKLLLILVLNALLGRFQVAIENICRTVC